MMQKKWILFVMTGSLLGAVAAGAQEASPWRIKAVSKSGFPPNAPRDGKGKFIYRPDKLRAYLDANGKTILYSASPGYRVIQETSGAKSRFWDRFLVIKLTLDGMKDPPKFKEFTIRDGKGQRVGQFYKAEPRDAGKPLPAGTFLLTFERTAFPLARIGEVVDLDNLTRLPPRNREWVSWKGLSLSGLEHQAPLEKAKDGKDK
jgi:hypothetical protein